MEKQLINEAAEFLGAKILTPTEENAVIGGVDGDHDHDHDHDGIIIVQE